MKINLFDNENKLLAKLGIHINCCVDYSDDEIEGMLDEIYLNEATNVEKILK